MTLVLTQWFSHRDNIFEKFVSVMYAVEQIYWLHMGCRKGASAQRQVGNNNIILIIELQMKFPKIVRYIERKNVRKQYNTL